MSKSLADIFEEIDKKPVALSRATQRARQAGVIGKDAELTVTIRAIAPTDYLALGRIPTWIFDPDEMASIPKDERQAKDKESMTWLAGLFKLAIVDPPFVTENPDRSRGEIALKDLMSDRETVINTIMEWSALFTVRDGDGGPFRENTEGPGGTEAVAGRAGDGVPAVGAAEGR